MHIIAHEPFNGMGNHETAIWWCWTVWMCGWGYACLYIKWCTLDVIFVKLPTTIYYWMPNDRKQNKNQTKPKQQMKKKLNILSQNVTSTGMISIEIYSPRDLFILFLFFFLVRSFLFLFGCVDFTWFQFTYTLWFYLNLFII